MRKRPRNKGARCQKWQRVPGRGGTLRCARYPRKGPHGGYKRGNDPENRGKTCVRRQRVYSPWHDKVVWRCASYGRGKAGRRSTMLFFKTRKALKPVRAPKSRPKRVPESKTRFRMEEGRVPLSLPSFERMVAGRTSGKRRYWRL